MNSTVHSHIIQEIRNHAIALQGHDSDYTSLLNLIGDARFVLIGEATHGTEEFYRIRADLTKQLIRYYGFSAVAVEADWPDSYRVNRYIRGDATIHNADSALSEFLRFPTWMWRNNAVTEFVDWMRDYNLPRSLPQEQIGFYGLDLYSMRASIHAVLEYLDKVDPDAGLRARHYYSCFSKRQLHNPHEYSYASALGIPHSCEQEVVRQLAALRQRKFDYLKHDGFAAGEDYFYAEQNAKLVADAENYYRNMFKGRVSSWNMRDQHMTDTLYALAEHLNKQRGEAAKIVVWAHNSHIGDARATEMGTQGELNIGQLVRQTHGRDAVLIGFSTYSGSVTAASEWDGQTEKKKIRHAMPESYEALFHAIGIPNFLLLLRNNSSLTRHLDISRLQRAIGVLYLPETEHQSHYFFSKLPEQFDAIIHLDKTTALRPLETTALWHQGEIFETYPSGF